VLCFAQQQFRTPTQFNRQDKTAKDMLDQKFRRQLLMDGKMAGSVVFIATQSDVLQPHEIKRTLSLPSSSTVEQCAVVGGCSP
jgi:hypothetical protein